MTLVSFLYVLLAILGLSFLIFIHELGHYYMARRLGMRVDTFSIGFGKPIYSWERDGVHWQIGWLLFGGYVKITGMDTSEQQDLYEIKDGFFSKSPLDRIKVAFMGPFVNIVFALLAFTALWLIGGREKSFAEYTDKIGWVDPKSELYMQGVRPGDEIASYNGQPYQGSKDHVTAPMIADGTVDVKGYLVNPATREKIPFDYRVKPYPHPQAIDKDVLTAGILQAASYVIYNHQPSDAKGLEQLPEGSPMMKSGVELGDRIVWVDGLPIYSFQQLIHILNDSKALLTIQRGQEIFLFRAPRVLAEELRLDTEFKEELMDWQFEAGLKRIKIQKLYVIPYKLNNQSIVESRVRFIDQEKDDEAFSRYPFSRLDAPLEPGDRILAVDGTPVTSSYEILSRLQQHHVNIIVERNKRLALIPSWQQADHLFDHEYQWKDLERIVSRIGLPDTPKKVDDLYLLNAVVPKMRKDFKLNPENQALLGEELEEQKREIEMIQDPEKRAQVRHQFEARDKQLLLGLPSIHDRQIQYNPNPLALFDKVFEEIWSTLRALVTGLLSPKWMSGPIGIVQVVHERSMVSLKESLFWLGAISLNLGVLNLLPFPVLDGGTICLSLFELLTGRRFRAKTLERLVLPFALLLIAFFIFLTYHDLARIFHWP
jgi:regulator of sigma E protease